jgi:hypothetical protein
MGGRYQLQEVDQGQPAKTETNQPAICEIFRLFDEWSVGGLEYWRNGNTKDQISGVSGVRKK